MVEFKLYIVQNSPRTAVTVDKLTEILKDEFNDHYALEVIDVFENAEMTERDGILATPTLIKNSPEPRKRIIGDFSDKESVFIALRLVGYTIE